MPHSLMAALPSIRSLLFPYRTHLESEVEYLRDQLAQEKRRCVELQNAILDLKQPSPKVYLSSATDKPPVKVTIQPKGWDAYRAAKRQENQDAESERRDDVRVTDGSKPA